MTFIKADLQNNQPVNAPHEYRVLNTDHKYAGFIQVKEATLQHQLFNGGWSIPLKREYVERRPAAGILLYDPENQLFALVEQFRVGAMVDHQNTPWHLEVVAGLIDDGDTAEQTVRRESVEEANVEVGDIELLHDFLPSAGASNERYTLFMGEANLKNAGGVYGLPEEGEDIKVHVYPINQLKVLLSSGQLHNASVIIALQALYIQLLEKGILSTSVSSTSVSSTSAASTLI